MKDIPCPCGSNQAYDKCCGRHVDGTTPAPTAEKLMRSRYTAYTLLHGNYLLATWHTSTRPDRLDLAEETPGKWIGLEVKRHQQLDATHALVEFVARNKVNGRAFRLHETSRFVLEDGRWFYVDGDLHEK